MILEERLLTSVADMLREMGYDAPILGELTERWAPKLYKFTRDVYARWLMEHDQVPRTESLISTINEEDGA